MHKPTPPFCLVCLLPILLLFSACGPDTSGNTPPEAVLLKGVTLIDGSGTAPQKNVSLLIRGDSIAQIVTDSLTDIFENARVVDMQGKTIMPLLIDAHAHLGLLKGTAIDTANYTRQNIIRQLEHYQHFGVGAVLSLGSDRETIFALRDSSQQQQLPGAMILTAGYGFSAPNSGPPADGGFDKVYRPTTPEQAVEDMRQLAALKPDFVKIWVDDFGGSAPKIKPEIYQAIITEAHRHQLPVAAHVYYLDDAKKLVAAGINVLAHSIRDKPVDDALLQMMKENNVAYIPTLTRDLYTFIFVQNPEWLNDPFFRASLELGVLDMLTSEAYLQKMAKDPALPEHQAAYEMAVRNLKKVYEAGIHIAMGTDSGAQPERAQGFSEHLELQLMYEAGIPVMDVIAIATTNAAQTLGIDKNFGTLAVGKKASFIILNSNPADDIKNTRDIVQVWSNGKEIGQSPVN